MNLFLPTVNALLNFSSFVFLILVYAQIKRGQKIAHQKSMVLALIFSSVFLICYLYYHYKVGSVPYPAHDWTRPLYFAILIPHVILAAMMVPFIVVIVFAAYRKNWILHKKWAKRVWPVWVFVSASGVAVYLLLYRHYW